MSELLLALEVLRRKNLIGIVPCKKKKKNYVAFYTHYNALITEFCQNFNSATKINMH